MSIIQGHAKSSGVTGFYNFPLEQSLRFNDDDSAYLSWTPDSNPTSAGIFTFSFWFKLSNPSSPATILYPYTDASNFGQIALSSNQLSVYSAIGGSAKVNVKTTAVLRDYSAWYHAVIKFNSTSGNEEIKIYLNGVDQSLTTTTAMTAHTPKYAANGVTHYLGSNFNQSGLFDGYLAEVNFIDGTALDADSFGELKNGVWIPKNPSGLTYGTNGFRLSFADDAEVEAFNTTIWRGDSSLYRSITGYGFAPDLVWIKDRNTARGPILLDTIRGVGNYLRSNETTQESTSATVIQRTFDSDGFTFGNNAAVNNSNETYVGWCWKAGGSSNTYNIDDTGYATASAAGLDGGTITPTGASVNTTYGFSIIGYQGTLADANIEHGLGVAPDMIIIKNRNRAAGTPWVVYHSAIGASQRILLNDTSGASSSGNIFGSTPTAPDATKFYVGNVNWVNNNVSGENDHIAYCWAEKANYSSFGSYTGDGTTDGSKTVDLGFDPAFVLIKEYDNNTTDGDSNTASGNWLIWDATRDTHDEFNTYLLANSADAENAFPGNTAGPNLQKITDGFAFINNNAGVNGSGRRYIYAAFADTREAAFWLDQENDNDWQPVNLDHNDTVADSPTDNFCTLNPLAKGPNNTLSDGNLQVVHAGTSGWQQCQSTFAFPESGKWYCEFTIVYQGDATDRVGINVSKVGYGPINTSTNLTGGNNANIWTYFAHTGSFYNNGSSSGSASTFGTGDVIQVSFDSDTGSLYFGKNGVWQNSGDPVAGTGYAYTGLSDVAVGTEGYSNAKVLANFGQQPFKYDPPE